MRTLEEKLATFKARNRDVLTSLAWQRNPTPLTSIWAAPVPEDHPAWELLRLNKTLMHERGFRAVRGEAGAWRLEVTLEQPGLTQSDLVVPAPEGLAYYPFQRVGVDFLSTRPAAPKEPKVPRAGSRADSRNWEALFVKPGTRIVTELSHDNPPRWMLTVARCLF
jgi:hypothetical protein